MSKNESENMRCIDKKVLDEVLQELNPEFVSQLPYSPEELLKYCKRRANPKISNNVNWNLGQSMLNHRLSDKDYLETFFKVVHYNLSGKKVSDKPKEIILIAQTGAGKTYLREHLLQENPDVVIINSDEYKRMRPSKDIEKINQEDAAHFGALTAIDSYDHASNLSELALDKGYDMLAECAPSMDQGLIGVDFDKLESKGYEINFHVMAVGDLVSAMAVHSRYEVDLMAEKNGNKPVGSAKLTDLSRHDESYEAVEKVIDDHKEDAIQTVYYRRAKAGEGKYPIPENKTLDELRRESNMEYISGGSNSKFAEDYKRIKSFMEMRNASKEQRKQLDEIFGRFRAAIADLFEKCAEEMSRLL